MLTEVAIAGIYLPPFLIYCVAAWALMYGIQGVLGYWAVLEKLWFPTAFELSLTCIVLVLLLWCL
ncbi:DUF1656 domain-containing protein [Acinetobacter larvae]|uniref:DUF1656 domain-containing protein n=1 Tax=Acinetobacter larvae TaxID=1789224 RepID=A0A1B2M0L4_9GAMM|nr:DUF1656 domain-containing protein [Acinetobacter larvae]AOA58709.1 hypothetical protein BFG52_10325 [Acinetobacter larvae]